MSTTFFYNTWLTIDIQLTRIACMAILQRMGITKEVTDCLKNIGLGTMGTKYYKLFPDLVHQLLATV